jgi:hypothetical protein
VVEIVPNTAANAYSDRASRFGATLANRWTIKAVTNKKTMTTATTITIAHEIFTRRFPFSAHHIESF